MPTVLDYYEYAKLANAAYINLDGKPTDGATIADQANEQSRIPFALANQTFDSGPTSWTIPANGYHGNDASGFAATLFGRTDAQGATEKVLALRGTEPGGGLLDPASQWSLDLMTADLAGIGVLGVAVTQLVELVNTLLLWSTQTTSQAVQLKLNVSNTEPAVPYSLQVPGTNGAPVYFYFTTTQANGLGLIGAEEQITVTGHSLGGHLAALAAWLFPGLVKDAYTYNAPGFDPSSVSLAQAVPGGYPTTELLKGYLASALGAPANGLASQSHQLADEFVALLAPNLPSPPAIAYQEVIARVHNVESENLAPGDDPSAVAGTFTNARSLGPASAFSTERNSHLIEPLMDSLGMHALLYRMNDRLTNAEITRLYEATSAQIGDTLETLTRSLHKAIVGTRASLTNVDIDEAGALWSLDAGDINGRRQYYDALLAVEDKVKAANGAFRLESLLDKPPEALANLAKDGDVDALAYRYALKEGNPFAVLSADYQTLHNFDGRLNRYDPATGQGELTDAWIEDRAKYLAVKLQAYAADDLALDGPPSPENWRYTQLGENGFNETIQVTGSVLGFPSTAPYRQMVFGHDGADFVTGGNADDRLYGGLGDDELNGGAGNDRLEGQRGNDIITGGTGNDELFGGAGYDGYEYNSGDGFDVIDDQDGWGYIDFDGVKLSGGARTSPGANIWQSPDGRFTYIVDGDLDTGATLLINGVITVRNFKSGRLGINLETVPTPVPPPPTGVAIFGTPGNDEWVQGTSDADYVYGDLGNDYVDGNFGDDVVVGGEGTDFLEGDGFRWEHAADGTHVWSEPGNDDIFADEYVDLSAMATFEGYGGAAGTGTQGDWLNGEGGNDRLVGSTSNDVLMGGAGKDTLLGGAGDDLLVGDGEDMPAQPTITVSGWSVQPVADSVFDYMMTGVSGLPAAYGPDPLRFGDRDVIYAGAGNDRLYGGNGNDVMYGEDGNDIVAGEGGDDVMFGGAGADRMTGDNVYNAVDDIRAPRGSDYIDGGEGDDWIQGDLGNDRLYGGGGNDEIWGDNGVLYAPFGTTVDPLLQNGSRDGDDYIDGGAGNDRLIGQGGNDVILGGDGDDRIDGDGTDSSASGHDGNDYLDGGQGNDDLLGGGGDDRLFGGAGNDLLFGDGDDVAVQNQGDDYLDGGDGNDYLRGYGGNDRMFGGAGADQFLGEDGNDYLDGGEGSDTLSAGAGADLVIGASGDDVLDGGQGNDVLVGGDGNDLLQGAEGDDRLEAGTGDDDLLGGAGNDYLDGGGGQDDLLGGEGDDTYYLNDQDGISVVTDPLGTLIVGLGTANIQDEGGTNRIVFGPAVAPADIGFLTVRGSATDFSVRYGQDVVTLVDGLVRPTVSRVEFSDGQILSRADIMALAPALALGGTAGADDILGSAQADQLGGGEGDDRLAGGKGNDSLAGGAGSDTYLFNLGDGQDVIDNRATDNAAAIDTLQLGQGITESDLVLNRVAADLVIKIGETERVTLSGYFAQSGGGNKIDRIAFADGTLWDQAAIEARIQLPGATAGNDTLTGFDSNDVIDGLGGNDTIYGAAGNDTVLGGLGDDQLYGDSGNDLLNGGPGVDTLAGGAGDDVYFFNRGDGTDVIRDYDAAMGRQDAIVFGAGIRPQDVQLARQSNGPYQSVSLVLKVATGSGTGWDNWITVENAFFPADNNRRIDQVRFHDGTVWIWEDIKARLITATDGNDLLFGYDGNDELMGAGGSDTLDGGDGNDVLDGGIGDDSLYGGKGDDVLRGGDGDDALLGDAGWVPYYYSNAVGNDVLLGGTGNDSLNGGEGNDWLDGESGDDNLAGGGGNDIYAFSRHQGSDRIIEGNGSASGGADEIRMGAGILPSEVTLYRSSDRLDRLDLGTAPDDLAIVLDGNGNELWIQDFFDSTADRKIETIRFADGTVWGSGEIVSRLIDIGGNADTQTGTAGDDVFVVDHPNDVINDTSTTDRDTVLTTVSYVLPSNVENLELIGNLDLRATGNAQDNTLRGNSGDNTFRHGGGLDTMIGGAGDDTYFFDNTEKYNGDLAIVVEQPDEGNDTVIVSRRDGYTLPDNVENVIYKPSAWYVSGATQTIRGNALDNTMQVDPYYGNNDVFYQLDGGSGADTYIATSRKEIFVLDSAADTIIGQDDRGISDTVKAAFDYTLGENFGSLILTGAAAIAGTGNGLNNTLDGSQNPAANALRGGLGDDTYVLGAGDTAIESAGEGVDTIAIAYDAAGSTFDVGGYAGIENLTLAQAAGAANLAGDEAANVLLGNRYANRIQGGVGNDRLWDTNSYNDIQVYGQDVLEGGAGDDTLVSWGGADLLDGGEGDDSLTGYGAVYRSGEAFGNDVIANNGSKGHIRFSDLDATQVTFARSDYDLQLGGPQGTGSVLVRYQFVGDARAIYSVDFTDGAMLSESQIATYVSQAGSVSEGNDVAIGTAGADALSLLGGDDLAIGGAGADSIDAGDGQDTVYGGRDGDSLAGGAGSDWLYGGDGADLLRGDAGTDYLYGDAGNDTLDGGEGRDILYGSEGADIFLFGLGSGSDVVDAAEDPAGPQWLDFVRMGSGVLAADVDVVRPDSESSDIELRIRGSGDILSLAGFFYEYQNRCEVDEVRFEDGTVWTRDDLVLRSRIITGTAGIDTLTGDSDDNLIYGLAGNDILSALEGNDLLDGGPGADRMTGGAGNDIYVVDNAGDIVSENAGEGIDLVQSGTTHALAENVENLLLTGSSAINGTGNALDNVLTGNSANNSLVGGAGNDRLDGKSGTDNMQGGTGDDTYVVNVSTDVVTEGVGEGIDTVESSVTWTLGSNLENLILTGTSAINATGNTLNNLMRGNSANNTLKGAGGSDALEGLGGNDALNDTSGGNYYNGGAGTDTLTGGGASDFLIGGTGNDTLTTGAGADVIAFNRGDGSDTINGGTGTDNTVSLGGGIGYADLKLRKSGYDLVLDVSATESLSFKNWYVTSANNKSVSTLQLILDATADYDAGSSNPLLNNKVEQFDFAGLASAFDQARAANPGLSSWALTNALASYYLSGSDSAAMGGDLAYYYGKNGSLTGMTIQAAQDVIGSANLGTANQTLRPFSGISGGPATLS